VGRKKSVGSKPLPKQSPPSRATAVIGERRWRGKRVLGYLALFGALLGGTCFVAMPYRTAAFMLDDWFWLVQIGLLYSGDSEVNWFLYLFVIDGDHALPLWKALYYFVWRVCGANPEYWRYLNWSMHALSAWAAFFLFGARRAACQVRCWEPHFGRHMRERYKTGVS